MDPSGRDILVLKRNAKDGLFRKQINLHSVGPDGYHSDAISRGEVIPTEEFDKVRKIGKDAFIIEVYDEGEKNMMIVAKSVWYCMYDIDLCIDRELLSMSACMSNINDHSRAYAEDYLESIGVPVRE